MPTNQQLQKNKQRNIDWLDYGARMYDPVIGRFHTLDPITEKHYSLAPKNYAGNNPIINIDLLGLEGINPNKLRRQAWVRNAPKLVGRSHAMSIRRGLQGIASIAVTGASAVYSLNSKLIGDVKNLLGVDPNPGSFTPLMKLEFDHGDVNSWDADLVPLSKKGDINEAVSNISNDYLDALNTNILLPQNPEELLNTSITKVITRIQEEIDKRNKQKTEENPKENLPDDTNEMEDEPE